MNFNQGGSSYSWGSLDRFLANLPNGLDKNLINNINLTTDIFIKINAKGIKLNKNGTLSVIKSNEIEFSSSKYVIYETDIRLLKKLLLGPKFAHWNNAEIGSHLKFYRKPNVLTARYKELEKIVINLK